MMTDSPGVLLDTHAWLWLELGDARFPEKHRAAMSAASLAGGLHVSAISMLEIANMDRRKRVSLPVPLHLWFARAFSGAAINLLPITAEIASEAASLPESFHGDPADRLIAATARVEDLTLCTHDKLLLLFGKQGLFRTLPI